MTAQQLHQVKEEESEGSPKKICSSRNFSVDSLEIPIFHHFLVHVLFEEIRMHSTWHASNHAIPLTANFDDDGTSTNFNPRNKETPFTDRNLFLKRRLVG